MIFPCPACCFKWHASRRRKASGVLGSLYEILLTHGQARHGGGHISNNIGAVRISAYIQKEKEVDSKRTDFKACADPHSFALFSYLHPGNKVKPGNVTPMDLNGIGSIMEIPVEAVFLAFFYGHPFVAQECCEFHCLVVSQFYSLPSVAFF